MEIENMEVDILLVEDDLYGSKKTIEILRKNKFSDKIIHLKNGKEANDFIFCTGMFENRNIDIQPKVIIYNTKLLKFNDIEFLNKLNADGRTKNISLVVLSSIEVNQFARSKENN